MTVFILGRKNIVNKQINVIFYKKDEKWPQSTAELLQQTH